MLPRRIIIVVSSIGSKGVRPAQIYEKSLAITKQCVGEIMEVSQTYNNIGEVIGARQARLSLVPREEPGIFRCALVKISVCCQDVYEYGGRL